MSDRRKSIRWSDLVKDERGALSSARCGLWVTVALALLTVGVDVWLTLHGSKVSIPNPAYALEGTMFTVFATWAGGPRIAQYIGPQIGQVASGIGSALRSNREPDARKDDERGEHTEREDV